MFVFRTVRIASTRMYTRGKEIYNETTDVRQCFCRLCFVSCETFARDHKGIDETTEPRSLAKTVRRVRHTSFDRSPSSGHVRARSFRHMKSKRARGIASASAGGPFVEQLRMSELPSRAIYCTANDRVTNQTRARPADSTVVRFPRSVRLPDETFPTPSVPNPGEIIITRSCPPGLMFTPVGHRVGRTGRAFFSAVIVN